jgi:hypothetical protein
VPLLLPILSSETLVEFEPPLLVRQIADSNELGPVTMI